MPMSFSHGTYFADSKMVERHKLRARSAFQENLAFLINVRKCAGKTGAYVFLSMKKGCHKLVFATALLSLVLYFISHPKTP